ncbi:MerR family transcriptional regulator [Bifidobacterium sp.]|uniref:MerR family transcriptional regulator n=1 Tax=Bifidobacterium sp. TaxID=41200 RepID=UPI0025C1182C|nr:MerR family transcriptional regulator [Bifidobacterium sp.]MCH4208561.1 MerR family transcriptional regulator [Bifidobacterium sp.]MCI1224247.1 MerR family transcriptional regulator [Bifidobacterium sp.]
MAGKTGVEATGANALKLHVRLEDRVDVTAENAVQGELFAFDDDEPITRGYRGTVASKVAGITYRQLDYWARKQIVEPSITPSHGSGSRRLYSFKDVVILAVSKRLLDAGVNLQNVTAAIGFLSGLGVAEIGRVTIMCDGEQVYQCTSADQIIDLVHSGMAFFSVSVDSLWHQIDEMLGREDSVDLTASPATATTSRPIDELTAMRMRKRLDAQKAARQAA